MDSEQDDPRECSVAVFPRNRDEPGALVRIFHSETRSFQRKIRPPSGRGDFVAASPDFVGPTGRRFHTSECEIFGLTRQP